VSMFGLDLDLQLLENILGQLDIKISELRDALRGADNRTLTDLYNKAYDSANDRVKIDAEVVANPSNLDVALSNFVGTPGSSPPTQGLAILGYDGTNVQRLKVDSAGELQVDVLSIPSIPSGTSIIGGIFAEYALGKTLDAASVGTSEVTGTAVDVRRRGRKVIYINNSQDVDITVDIDVSPDGSDWYTIKSDISVPAGAKKLGIMKDAHGYVRARAVASSAPSSGSVTVAIFSMM